MTEFDTILFHDYTIVSVTGVDNESSDSDSLFGDEFESDMDDNAFHATDDIYSDNHHWDIRMSQPVKYRYKPEIWCDLFFSDI